MTDIRQEPLRIVVEGHPEPGGSKTAMPLRNKHTGKWLHASDGRPLVNVIDANTKAPKWKKAVAAAAADQYDGPLLDGPLLVSMDFYLHRWKSHYGTGRNARKLLPSAPLFPAADHPDVLKLARPVEDALTGVVWTDDAYTQGLVANKWYVDGFCVKGTPGEHVVIRVSRREHVTVGDQAMAAQGTLLSA